MTERKYRKPVNANGWMRRLQKWTWGRATPSFVGYCPFFWFTWLCLFLTPITLVFKTVAFVFRFVFSAIPETFWITRPRDESLLVELYKIYLTHGLEHIRDILFNCDGVEEFLKWVAVTPDWENCIKAIIAKREKKAQKKLAQEPKRAALARRASRYSGYIVKPILAALLLLVLYYILPRAFRSCVVIWHLILGITLSESLFIAKGIAIFTVAVLVLWAFIALLVRFIEGMRGCPKKPETIGIIYKCGLAISNGAGFLLETISALYTSECPLIEWDDHDEPIQRR